MCGRVALFTMRGKRNEGEVELCVEYTTKMDACAKKNKQVLKYPLSQKKVFFLEFAAFGETWSPGPFVSLEEGKQAWEGRV